MIDDVIRAFPDTDIGSGIHLDPDKLLEHWKGKLSEVVIIGNRNGEPVIVGSEGVERSLWLIEKAKAELLES